jgi:hypothetical protein
MPPKSQSRKRTRGGAAPPSTAAATATPAALDTSLDLDNIPSPVTLPLSHGAVPTWPGAATPSVRPPSAQGAAPPSATDMGDPYAFLAKVPSRVTVPSELLDQQSVAVTPSDVPASPRTPAATSAPAVPPPTSQSAARPTPMGGESAFAFLDKVPSRVSIPPSQSGQGADTVRLFIFI